MKPFRIDVPEERLDWIRRRVAEFEWHEMPENGGWAYGTPLEVMRDFAAHWLDRYDWRAEEASLNTLPQFTAEVDGLDVHFVHAKGTGPSPTPLLISHGWPGSIAEFRKVIEPLTAGDPSFDVVAPSLPGYAWSRKPPRPMGPRAVGKVFSKLMTDVLGYDGYVAQGGDWGSAISGWIGHDDPKCRAVHLNMVGIRPNAKPETPEEKAWAQSMKTMMDLEAAYFRIQATKPQTLSYAMMDSPIGVAAWILEKFHTWSDLRGTDDLEERYGKDELLTNVMIYVTTRTFNTASWMYRGLFEENASLPPGERIEKPTGIAHFPRDTWSMPPRSFVERAYRVVRWTDMPSGGHFAAMEEPELFVRDLRAFAAEAPF